MQQSIERKRKDEPQRHGVRARRGGFFILGGCQSSEIHLPHPQLTRGKFEKFQFARLKPDPKLCQNFDPKNTPQSP